MQEADFALFNVDQLVTVAPESHPDARGSLGIIERGALASRGGKIVWVGLMSDFHDYIRLTPDAMVVNTHGRCVLPGFVDPHTHPIFAGSRVDHFYDRAHGHKDHTQARRDIMQTIEATRAASEEALLDAAFERADAFLRHGTTTIGGRTGYGLTQDDEIKCLRVLNRLQHIHCLKVIPAFLGARILPDEFQSNPDAYVDMVIKEWLPAVKDRVQFVDVWGDDGALTVEQCRRILEAAKALGFLLTAHANDLGPHGGAQMAAGLGARSIGGLQHVDDEAIRSLLQAKSVAVLLPGTDFFLNRDQFPPGRRLLDAGVEVALGTDFNPEMSFTQNMQIILTLAVLKMGMTAEEAIRSATLAAAKALDMDDCIGSLEPGKYCDFVVYRLEDYREIPYRYGMNMVDTVVTNGGVVVQDGGIVPAARAGLRAV